MKTGKEADVFLIRRGVPQGRSCLLAAKRYRDAGHRMFHRDSGYLEGRRTRESRVNRAVAGRTAFGRQAIAGQWAQAEFSALARLYAAGIPVPYPAQILDTELLLEFIGSADGVAAPRLAETRPGPAELAGLWDQLVQALIALARDGLAHGDLSAYNLLVHDGRLVMIDLPQVVDVIANPRGAFFLTRDAENVGRWFAAHGLAGRAPGTRGPARPAPPRGPAGSLKRAARPAYGHGCGNVPLLVGRSPQPSNPGRGWRGWRGWRGEWGWRGWRNQPRAARIVSRSELIVASTAEGS